MSNGEALVAFDVDSIKSFVFASSRPMDVTGASELVKRLNPVTLQNDWLSHWNTKVVYANGGTGLVRVARDDIDSVTRQIEEQYRRLTITGSCSAVPFVPPGELNEDRLQEAIKVLGTKLQLRKSEKAAQEIPETWTMGYLQRCEACGVYPAAHTDLIGDEEQERICDSCNQRRQLARRMRDDPAYPRDLPEMAQSLSDIVGDPPVIRYLSVIYGDADRAGELMLHAASAEELEAYSDHMWQSVQGTVRDTITGAGLAKRYQSPVVGGDDIVMFVPATHALEVLNNASALIAEKIKQLPGALVGTQLGNNLQNVTFTFSMLIAPHHMPIPYLFEYVEALLKEAKSRAYEVEQPAVDFWWIRGGSPLSTDFGRLREDMRREFGRSFPLDGTTEMIEEIHLTGRPYTRAEFDEMMKEVRALDSSDVAKSQLHRLSQTIWEDEPHIAHLNILYQAVRTSELQTFLKELNWKDLADWPKYFFRVRQQPIRHIQIPFLDLVELYELATLGG